MERKDLLDLLVKKGLTLSSMESLTGGMFATAFTSISGASKVFKGAAVTYTDEIKESFGVKKETIDTYGAVSMQTSKEMALRASIIFNTDVSVSFTGNAGPEPSENKPVGLVFISIKVQNKLFSYELHFNGERDDIRRQCVDFAFKELIAKLSDNQY
jgi:PncC family amidohydrolase